MTTVRLRVQYSSTVAHRWLYIANLKHPRVLPSVPSHSASCSVIGGPCNTLHDGGRDMGAELGAFLICIKEHESSQFWSDPVTHITTQLFSMSSAEKYDGPGGAPVNTQPQV